MYTLPTHNYLERQLRINQARQIPKVPLSHAEKVKQQLIDLGVSKAAFLRKEFRVLPSIIDPNETIGGIIYGKSKEGFVVLAATDRRVIYLDEKLLYTHKEEISYEVVAGVNIGRAGPASTVILNTRIKNYSLQTLNLKTAKGFVAYMEARVLEHKKEENI